MSKARLEELYNSKVRPELQKKLGLKNIMEVPKITKIVLNVGVKDAIADSKVLQSVMDTVRKNFWASTSKNFGKKIYRKL